MTQFASYEKEYVGRVETIRHTIKIKLNSRAIDIKTILANVPDTAIVTMIVDDSELGNYGEIVFEEAKSI